MTTAEHQRKTLGVLMIGFSPVVREGLQAILAKDAEMLRMSIGLSSISGRPGPGTVCQRSVDRNPERRHGRRANYQAYQRRIPADGYLVLTDNLNDFYVIDAIHAGAGGYIFLHDVAPEELLQSIHRVVEGGTQMKAVLLRTAVENLIQNGRKTLAERTAEAAHLTGREVDVLRLMGNGDSNKSIAETLGITLDTAKKHVRNVIDKMQARSRTHASIIRGAGWYRRQSYLPSQSAGLD